MITTGRAIEAFCVPKNITAVCKEPKTLKISSPVLLQISTSWIFLLLNSVKQNGMDLEQMVPAILPVGPEAPKCNAQHEGLHSAG